LTRFAAGTVAWSLLLLALGRAGAFSQTLVLALTLPATAAGVLVAVRFVREVRVVLPADSLSRVASSLVVLALALDVAAATAPPSSADALKYHLALPRTWLDLGSIGDPFWVWEGFGPSSLEMLYGQALAVGNGSAAGAIHAFFAVATALAVFGAARRLAGGCARAGVLAAAVFVLQGLVTWEATSSFIELGLAFYIALAFWYALDVRHAPSVRTLAWCGFAAGAAAGTKYVGLLAGGLVVGGALLAVPRAARVRGGVIAACTAILAGGGWYV
jgi:hypothetical protein